MPIRRFVRTWLSPQDRLAEGICALVMVLTVTAYTRAAVDEPTRAEFLIAVLGCNAAWGLVDGATYVFGGIQARGRRIALHRALHSGVGSPAAAHEAVAESVGDLLPDPDRQRQVTAWVEEAARARPPERPSVKREDLYAGLACFILMFLGTLPVAAPYVLLRDVHRAILASTGVAVAMLFAIGWRWGAASGFRPLRAGLLFTLIGVALAVLTQLLGG